MSASSGAAYEGKRGRPALPPDFDQYSLAQAGDFLAFRLGRDGVLRHVRQEIGTADEDRSATVSSQELGMLLALIYRHHDQYPAYQDW